MKKFINDVSQVEDQMIQGMVKAYPDHLRKLDCGNVVVRAQKKEGKVALISGGGSGHEPVSYTHLDSVEKYKKIVYTMGYTKAF